MREFPYNGYVPPGPRTGRGIAHGRVVSLGFLWWPLILGLLVGGAVARGVLWLAGVRR